MYRVLIVDDERSIRNGLKHIIPWEDYGFSHVETAANGQEALELMDRLACDLLITDLKMPLMDGLTLIRTLFETKRDISTVILSGYQDFSSAREALKYNVDAYLLKPIDPNELSECVSVVRRRLEEKYGNSQHADTVSARENEFIYNLVRGKVNLETHETQILKLGITAGEIYFCLALVQVEATEQLDILETKQFDFQIRNIIWGDVSEFERCMVYDESRDVIGLLFYGDKTQINTEHLETVLGKICTDLHRSLRIFPYITYGNIVDKLEDVRLSWQQAQTARERELMAGNDKVVSYNQVLFDEKLAWDLTWENKLLLDAIENNNQTGVKEQVALLADEIEEKAPSRKIVRAILYSLFLDISRKLRKYNGNLSDLMSYMSLSDYIEKGDYRELRDWLTDICGAITEYVEKLQVSLTSGVVYRVQQYVHQNYGSEMTLQSIAAKFYINPSYLGRLFKKTIGVSFNEYLNKYRISRIKQMLHEHKGKISEIIEKSGYNNPEYFYRQFKKYEGISFMEYREHLRNHPNA